MPFVPRYDLSEIYIYIYRIRNNVLIDHYVYRIRSNVLIDHYVSEMFESLSVCYSFIVMCSHIETPICIYKLYPIKLNHISSYPLGLVYPTFRHLNDAFIQTHICVLYCFIRFVTSTTVH
jgi:hypothetical protein